MLNLAVSMLYGIPCMLGALIIARHGLLSVITILVIEMILMFVCKHVGKNVAKSIYRPWIGVIASSAGIVLGAAIYPVQSSPDGLGAAAVFLAVVIHAALYLIADALIRP